MTMVAERRILHSQMSISVFCKECGSCLPGSGSSGRGRRERDPANSVLLPGGEPVWQVQGSGARAGYSAARGNGSCLDNFPFGKCDACRFIPLILQKEGSKTGNRKQNHRLLSSNSCLDPCQCVFSKDFAMPDYSQQAPVVIQLSSSGRNHMLAGMAESQSEGLVYVHALSLHLRLNVQVVQLDFQ